MVSKNREEQVESFRIMWEQLMFHNKLEVCCEKLKGATILDVNILGLIYNDSDITPKKITETLGIPNSTLTNAINRLTKKELLERKLNSNDLRSFRLELTKEGQSAIVEHHMAQKQLIENILSLLNEDELPVLFSVFEKLTTNL